MKRGLVYYKGILAGELYEKESSYYFEALARNLKIPEKTMANIFNRFIKVLPSWIAFINKSFLSAEMQEKYIEILKHKHKHLFSSIIKG